MRVLFIGREDAYARKVVEDLGLHQIVQCLGRVPYEESLRYIASAHVCLLIEMEMEEGIYLPSKLADYVISNTPVIAVSPKQGVVSDLSSAVGICRVDRSDPRAISDAILSHYRAFEKRELEKYAPSPDLRRNFDEESIVGTFLDLARRLTGDGQQSVGKS
jgi:glycosyltransferase involved in cell wall biosynthesis